MLDSYPSILCHHEIYNPKGIRLAVALRETDFTLGTMAERERDPEAFLERIWFRPDDIETVGFKFSHRQNLTVYHHLLTDPGIAKIILRRRNRMKIYVSQKISEALCEWEVYQQADLLKDRPRVTVDPQLFLERVTFDENYYAEVQEAMRSVGQSWIDVYYEDLFSSEAPRRIVEFLGLDADAGELSIGSVKQNSRDLRDLVENYDELCRYFEGTEYAQELTDLGD